MKMVAATAIKPFCAMVHTTTCVYQWQKYDLCAFSFDMVLDY